MFKGTTFFMLSMVQWWGNKYHRINYRTVPRRNYRFAFLYSDFVNNTQWNIREQ